MRRPSRADPESCAHPVTLILTSAGLDRVVCESCGQVKVRFRSALTGIIDRQMFARPADTQAAAPAELPDAQDDLTAADR